MTHVVTGRCVDCRYTDCCTVCPVDCFWETKDPALLVIDPETFKVDAAATAARREAADRNIA